VLRQRLRDRRRQGRLPMVNMPNRPDIHVRLATVKFLFRHMLLRTKTPGISLLLNYREKKQDSEDAGIQVPRGLNTPPGAAIRTHPS
jgi:hypothetical protein